MCRSMAQGSSPTTLSPTLSPARRGGSSSLRVIFLTHYFAPEVGAPQSRLLELATRVVAAGHTVTVVTGFPNYPTGIVPPDYRGRRSMEEAIDGVRVLRTAVYATPNKGFLRRILNHLSFAVSSVTAVRRTGPADVIFVESPPLFIGFAALAYTRLKRTPFIFNVSDIWPQSAVELGALRNRLAIRLAEMFERHVYRRAARVSVVTPGMVERLAARGIPREKLFLLTNGVDTALFQPAEPDLELGRASVYWGARFFSTRARMGWRRAWTCSSTRRRRPTTPTCSTSSRAKAPRRSVLWPGPRRRA